MTGSAGIAARQTMICAQGVSEMSTRKPNEREKLRAVRYMRHMENCPECYGVSHPTSECAVGAGHWRRWASSYYREAKGTCKHWQEGECWEDRCRGGKKAR